MLSRIEFHSEVKRSFLHHLAIFLIEIVSFLLTLEGGPLDPLDLLEQVVNHAVLVLKPHIHVMLLRLELAVLDRLQRAVSLLRLEGLVEGAVQHGHALDLVEDGYLAHLRGEGALGPGTLREAPTVRL